MAGACSVGLKHSGEGEVDFAWCVEGEARMELDGMVELMALGLVGTLTVVVATTTVFMGSVVVIEMMEVVEFSSSSSGLVSVVELRTPGTADVINGCRGKVLGVGESMGVTENRVRVEMIVVVISPVGVVVLIDSCESSDRLEMAAGSGAEVLDASTSADSAEVGEFRVSVFGLIMVIACVMDVLVAD